MVPHALGDHQVMDLGWKQLECCEYLRIMVSWTTSAISGMPPQFQKWKWEVSKSEQDWARICKNLAWMWQRTGGLLEINQNSGCMPSYSGHVWPFWLLVCHSQREFGWVGQGSGTRTVYINEYKWININHKNPMEVLSMNQLLDFDSWVGIGRKQISRSWNIGSTKITWYSLISARQ